MRCTISLCVSVTLSLILNSYALPFSSQEQPRFLQPRAKYAVVAVDGSSDGNTASPMPSADIPPKADSQPQVQTKTVTAIPTEAQISVVTVVATRIVEPVPPIQNTANAKANVPIVNVNAVQPQIETSKSSSLTSTTSVAVTAGDQLKPSCSPTAFSSISSATWSPSVVAPPSSPSTPIAVVTSSSDLMLQPPPSVTPPVLKVAKVNVAPPPEITSTSTISRTFDDGLWHTTWRVWNETSSTLRPSQSATSSLPVW